MNPCSVSATKGIHHSNLNSSVQMTLLSKFCDLMKYIDKLVNARNTVFAHTTKGELSDEDFRQLWNEIENSIVFLSKTTGTDIIQTRRILELREEPLEEFSCLEVQCLILRQMHEDEQIIRECHQIQGTVKLMKEDIAVKLQQIELQIVDFKSFLRYNIQRELSEQLGEYSDISRNLIDNSGREIKFHNNDKTYVKTSAVIAAIEVLDRENMLILIGRAGSGKSSAALEIASIFQNKGYIVMNLEQHLAKDFKTYFLSTNKQFIILEDLFGKSHISYNEDIHSHLLDAVRPHVTSGQSKFIITLRSNKLEDFDKIVTNHQLLSEASIININGNFSLSTLEKKAMLINHSNHHGHFRSRKAKMLEDVEIQNIIKTNPYLGFPEACRLFCSFETFFAMGHKFFTSPTKELQSEIRRLKRSGYDKTDAALQYCVLVSLMLDRACEGSFGRSKGIITREHYESFTDHKNVNTSVIVYLYQSLFNKEITVTTYDVLEMCEEVSDKYIKIDITSNIYVFQHHTGFHAVLSSYWDIPTMEDVIQVSSVNTLAEYVRPYDVPDDDERQYLIVPQSKCSYLAQKLFNAFLTNYFGALKFKTIVENSQFTLILLNQIITDWYAIKLNVLNCDWSIINTFIRPSQFKRQKDQIGTHTNDIWLIQRLINEILKPKADNLWAIYRYIEDYGCDEFVKNFNEKLSETFQSEEVVVSCSWHLINLFIYPSRFKMKNAVIGTPMNDKSLIERLINEIVKPKADNLWAVQRYVVNYGCEQFVKDFNEKLSESFQSEKNVLMCSWHLINLFIYPTAFKIKNGVIGVKTNDTWLIQRLINEILKPTGDNLLSVHHYIEDYGCDELVKDFNEKFEESFQSDETKDSYSWHLINVFIYPAVFKMTKAVIGIRTNDSWLIQRLINEIVKSKGDNLLSVQLYIEDYGCDEFVKGFNDKLAEWFHTRDALLSSSLNLISVCVRPSSFKIQNGKIGITTNNSWLIQRFLTESVTSHVDKLIALRSYITKYGCEEFVMDFNTELAKSFQTEETVVNGVWDWIHHFVRPTTSKIRKNDLGTHTKDSWLIQRLINEISKPKPSNLWAVHRYIEEYGCTEFIEDFNRQLSEVFQSEKTVENCSWHLINLFIYPIAFKIRHGAIGIHINDSWLIQRFINEITKPKADKIWAVRNYIAKKGCEKFVKDFNDKLSELFQSEGTVLNCSWYLIDLFIYPAAFKIKDADIGIHTNDRWLIQRLIKEIVKPKADNLLSVQRYIKDYGGEEFVKGFKEKLAERF
ncbi:uncharacterized protein LOC134697874 [Mytilus trossulus]|uniref:uncharacterized protein LOC134697874 n=1 Tax=Mytilus trossulus TaxID=6551 RepID=UPI003007D3ED